MITCDDCGTVNTEGARYCSNCGHGIEHAPTPKAKNRDLGFAELLLLVGAVLALVYIALFVIVWSTLPAGDTIDRFDVRFLGFTPYFTYPTFALALLLLWVLAVAGTFYARALLAVPQVETSGLVATVSGVILLVSGPWLAGLLVLTGGVLIWFYARGYLTLGRTQQRPAA